MQGIICIDKPSGWTSFDVVNYVRKIVAQAEDKKPRSIKVGHSGTLDPFATGLLILLVGKEYTKRAREFSRLDKTYEVTVTLGYTSDTGDPEGKISHVSDRKPSETDIIAVLKEFKGVIRQTPPGYSAIKIDGQRAYKLKRAGKEVNLEPREVTITALEIIGYTYPNLRLKAEVSSGTYIRALAEDIGCTLGVGAYASNLRRIRIGTFDIARAVSVEQLDIDTIREELKIL